MDTNKIIRILRNAVIYLIVVMLVSFVLDVGFSNLGSEPIMKTLSDWLVSVFKITKLGVWIVVVLIFAYFRERQGKN
ncbi:MAG: hypothetical protein IPP05_10505 [Cytophagaceae bacterium]|nr:hypothetical protein [Cytophagaceae bacterium]MBK9934552.1 hypothetical protein [Cytophagaceae bacterium]